jgi:hypothetical protein
MVLIFGGGGDSSMKIKHPPSLIPPPAGDTGRIRILLKEYILQLLKSIYRNVIILCRRRYMALRVGWGRIV